MKAQLTKSLIAVALIALLASSAGAVVLHDQGTIEPNWQQGFLNTVAGAPPFGTTLYGMSDVQVGGTGWIITSVQISVQSLGSFPTLAYLNIFDKTGPLPTAADVPNQDTAVPCVTEYIDGTDQMYTITASGLNIPLEPGAYWIGLTPLESSFFYSTHAPAETQMYDFQATYDPSFGGSWGNIFRDWDATILIEGMDDVVATEGMSMGSIKALYR